ncbi:MAG: cation transporter [Desulfobulbaceae bacterium]|nr:cation transporter [Desulfobulbaceae bacterium]
MTTIKVEGMKCQHCVGNTKKALEELVGISNVNVDLEKGEVSFDGEAAMEDIKAAVAAKGFTVVD